MKMGRGNALKLDRYGEGVTVVISFHSNEIISLLR